MSKWNPILFMYSSPSPGSDQTLSGGNRSNVRLASPSIPPSLRCPTPTTMTSGMRMPTT